MKASKPYFSHDICTKSDEKIIRLMFDFRKCKKDFPEETLRELVAHAAYGIYWEIIEYLHENSLKIAELDMLADELRVDSEILKRILCNYDLFKELDGKYISERVLRNLKLQEEKGEKARQSINQRWKKKKKETPEEEPANQEPEEEYNEEFVMSIIQIYNEKFKKSQIVSNKNKQRIFKIHTKNKLTLDIWKTIFSNAKRGWDIGDKKNVPPNLKKILDEWDSFASDDYFLAPNREEMQRKKEEEAIENIKKREQAAAENAKFNQIRKERYEAINSKQTALEYLYDYSPVKDIRFLQTSRTYKDLAEKFGITKEETINFLASKGAKNV